MATKITSGEILRDLLKTILTTKCDSGGRLPFSNRQQQWAMQVCRTRPYWALDVLNELEIPAIGGLVDQER